MKYNANLESPGTIKTNAALGSCFTNRTIKVTKSSVTIKTVPTPKRTTGINVFFIGFLLTDQDNHKNSISSYISFVNVYILAIGI
jgi:hypothetical protein